MKKQLLAIAALLLSFGLFAGRIEFPTTNAAELKPAAKKDLMLAVAQGQIKPGMQHIQVQAEQQSFDCLSDSSHGFFWDPFTGWQLSQRSFMTYDAANNLLVSTNIF